jgi:protocatechuate 3,4-dioxygenase, alpha subunit
MTRTPSQTVGPYYAIGCCRRDDNVLDPGGVPLTGTLFDGQGEPIWDGMIELWDPVGKRWGRSGTHPNGDFAFSVPRDVPYVYAYVFARGLLRHQLTKIHFGEPDPQFPTLVATPDGDGFRFDIRMQGPDATVFFDH